MPLDFSRGAEATVPAAFDLARRRGAQVHLLDIAPARKPSRLDDEGGPRAADWTSSKRDWSAIEPAIQVAQKRRIRVRAFAYRGDAATIIASHAQLTSARLIILGQHFGTSAWRRSTRIAGSVSRSAPVPVLVLPPQPGSTTHHRPLFRHVVSAVDLTVASAVALRTVIGLIRDTRARLTLVHALNHAPDRMVFSGGEALKARKSIGEEAAAVAERLRRRIPADANIRVDARVTTGAPARVILAIASEVDADLVVMGVAPRARFDEVLFGSTLQRVLSRTAIPLLVLPVLAGANNWSHEADGVELSLTGAIPGPVRRLRVNRR